MEALDLLCRLRWDGLHRVYFVDTELTADDSCLVLDVTGVVNYSAEAGAATMAGPVSADTEDQLLPVIRSTLSALALALTKVLPSRTLR